MSVQPPEKGLTRPLSAIKERPEQIRKHCSREALERLVASIRDNGLLQPVVIDKDGWLLAGHSRLEAVKRLGWESVPVRIVEGNLDETQKVLLAWAENEDREGVTAYEQWQAVERLKVLNPTWTNKQVADPLHVDASMIPRLLSPGKCIKPAQDALKAGQLGISHTYALSKEVPERQAELLAALLNGASRADVEHQRRKARNGAAAPQERLNRWNVPLAAGITVSVVGKELSLDQAIDALVETVKEAKKAREQGLSGVTWVAAMKDKVKGAKS